MPGGFVSFGKYNAHVFVVVVFPEEQLSGFVFIEARKRECSFCSRAFLYYQLSLTHKPASASPSHILLRGTYVHTDAVLFMPLPFYLKLNSD